MALAPAGGFGLGGVSAPFSSPKALRLYYYGTGDGIHTMYPGDLVSRIPDNADWLPNITGIGGQGQIHGFVGPIITTPGVAANGGQGYAYDAHGDMLFWDANGHLVTQQNLPASSGAAVFATSAADAYDPASPHFGLTIANADKSFTSFEPVEAVSVAGRMANLGEDEATATARAAAASKILGVAVKPLPPKTVAPPPPPSYATPPGQKLPVNLPPSSPGATLPVNLPPSSPGAALPVNLPPSSGSPVSETQAPVVQTPGTAADGTPAIASVAQSTSTNAPATAGFSGIAALLLGGGLLFAMTRKKK